MVLKLPMSWCTHRRPHLPSSQAGMQLHQHIYHCNMLNSKKKIFNNQNICQRAMKCKFNTNTAELNMKNPQNDKFRKHLWVCTLFTYISLVYISTSYSTSYTYNSQQNTFENAQATAPPTSSFTSSDKCTNDNDPLRKSNNKRTCNSSPS